MPLWPDLALLAAIVAAGFLVEATLGFGSAMVSLSIAGLLWPVQTVVPLQVALGLLVSTYLVTRYRRDVAVRHLLRVYLPAALLGLPVGIVLGSRLAGAALDRIFGAVVLVLAAFQLLRALVGGPTTPLPGPVRSVALFGAGIMHGLYAIGGPLVVYVTSREAFAKSTFRATLSALWLVLGVFLLGAFIAQGRFAQGEASTVALLVPPVLVGTRLGEWLHHRVPERPFRVAVLSLLVLIGAKLALS